MKERNVLILALLMLLTLSCKDEEKVPSVKASTISFEITALNGQVERFKKTPIQIESEIVEKRASQDFYHYSGSESQDSVVIFKTASFDFYSDPPAGENYCESIAITLEKKEAKSNLKYDAIIRQWAYKDMNEEYHLLYEKFDSAHVYVGQCYLHSIISSARSSDDFHITEICKVLVDGKEEWLIKAQFKGEAYAMYWHEETPYFDIQNGKFEGVLK